MFFLPLILSVGLNFLFDFKKYSDDVIMAIFTLTYYLIFVIWNYKVIRTFNKRQMILKPKHLKRLDWLLIILIIYTVYLIIPIEYKMNGNLLMNILSPIVMIFSAYAIFFMIFCTAKTLKRLQLQDNLRTADIIVEMFVIFYFPIGVWWLQKKVNLRLNDN